MTKAAAKYRNRRYLTKAGIGAGMAVALIGAVLTFQRGPVADTPLPFQMVAVARQDAAPLLVQAHELTVADWNRCHDAGGCALKLSQPDPDRTYPATGLSYSDAMEYVRWINDETGRDLRLPTSAEWYAIASEVLPEKPDPIFTSPDLTWASAYLLEAPNTDRRLRPTGSYSTTRSGIADMDGNVWEWTQDCYSGESRDRCPAFIMGGEHEAVMSFLIRDPARGGCAVGAPPAHLGMRLVSGGKG